MEEEAQVKRFHGADIPSDPRGKRLAWGTKHLKVQCYLSRSLNSATYEMFGALWVDPVEKKD